MESAMGCRQLRPKISELEKSCAFSLGFEEVAFCIAAFRYASRRVHR
jgi:hypothetical protein